MKKYGFKEIEDLGLLLYRYVRGSHAYGTQLPGGVSDIDEGGVYIEPIEQVLGLGYDFQDEISDEKHDKVWYGLKKYMNLLCTSNPNILESLFVDDEFVIYEHPIITELKKHRQEFVTKECFNSFIGYSVAQIKRAKGYNKLCVQPIEVRKMPIDFCYTTYKQGTSNITDWLTARGLKQQYCGLVSLNNMPDCYGVYYDFGAHNHNEYDGDYEKFESDEPYYRFVESTFDDPYIGDIETFVMAEWFENTQTPIGYRGVVKDYSVKIPVDDVKNHKEIIIDNEGDYCFYDKDTKILTGAKIIEEDGVQYIVDVINESDTVRCSSIPKDAMPICTMSYNKDGFTQHCNKYKQYQDWVKKRNQARFIDNEGYNFDAKNVMHCFRLINMGLEIATTGEVHVNRKGRDAEFLLDIRNHKYDYDYLITELEKKKNALDEAIAVSTLPEAIDRDRVNQLLIDVRYKYQINK